MKTKTNFLRIVLMLLLFGSASASIAQSSQTPTQSVCVGNQPYLVTANPDPTATYTWSITPGTAGVNWTINGSSNSITIDWLIPGVYTLSVFTSANGCSGPPTTVEVTVVAQPVGPTLLAKTPAGPDVCDGTPVSATFTAGSGGVGCADEYQYRYDGTGTWSTYTPGDALSTTGHTMVEIQGRRAGCTSGAGCTGTDWVTLASWNVTALLLPTVNITASADPVCAGTSVTYTANVTNGGTPTYEWHVNGGSVVGTSSTYSYVPQTGDVVTCIVVANAACTSTAPVTGTFNPVVNPLPTTSPIWHN